MNQSGIKGYSAFLKGFLCVAAFVLVLSRGSLAAEAVKTGISLVLNTLIPALLPLLFLSKMIMVTDIPEKLGSLLGPVMRRLFSAPPQAAICFVLGILGGYPMGAQAVADSFRAGRLTREQGEYLLSFCSNAGPAFIFGVFGTITGSPAAPLALYVIHVVSALLVGVILRPRHITCQESGSGSLPVRRANVLYESLCSMGAIGMCVVLMQIVLAGIEACTKSWMPPVLQTALTGFLELSSGSLALGSLDSLGWRYCMASGFLGFGGICVWLQTISVLRGTGLRTASYLWGKVLQCGIAMLLTWGVIVLFPGLLPLDAQTVQLPNHTGLWKSMVWTAGVCFLLFGIWCAFWAKKSGKTRANDV